ncbi:MAG: hypothetical protein HOP08_00635 [Cyclobacteriaceae bacterium]|nr:hypothetical protein [Cyclobacteriaceae bacterium]
MKRIYTSLALIVMITLIMPAGAAGQTWDEWFHQEWTQGEYHKEEIFKRWAFLETVSDGLKVVGKGLNAYSNIINGELNLHRDFFGSRSNINPNVSGIIDFIEVLHFQWAIVRDMNKVYDRVHNSARFSADEVHYVERVHRNLLVMTDANVSELVQLLRIRDREMTDNERLARTNEVLEEMRDQRDFVNSFSQSTTLLDRARARDIDEADRIRRQYETY